MEEQYVLRLPPKLAEEVRKSLQDDSNRSVMNIEMDGNTRRGWFFFNQFQYPAVLVDLPTNVETLKTYNRRDYVKTAAVSQMVVVKERVQDRDPVEDYPSGLSAAFKNIRHEWEKQHDKPPDFTERLEHLKQLLQEIKEDNVEYKEVYKGEDDDQEGEEEEEEEEESEQQSVSINEEEMSIGEEDEVEGEEDEVEDMDADMEELRELEEMDGIGVPAVYDGDLSVPISASAGMVSSQSFASLPGVSPSGESPQRGLSISPEPALVPVTEMSPTVPEVEELQEPAVPQMSQEDAAREEAIRTLENRLSDLQRTLASRRADASKPGLPPPLRARLQKEVAELQQNIQRTTAELEQLTSGQVP
jgi:transcription initiation factor TFIID subunit 7